MKKLGLSLFGIGLSGFLIGGSGLDGAASAECMILTAASFLVAAVGYNIYKKSERGEKNKAAKEIDARPKEATFQMWLTSGRLDV